MRPASGGLGTMLVWILVLGVGVAATGGALELTFRRLNRTYEAFVSELAPIEIGPARVGLRSPEHELQILQHRARLAPAAAGGHQVELEVRFAGHGRIEADVLLGGVASQLADELVVPEQTLVLAGRAEIVSSEEGYRITALELPETVAVRIESRLAGRLVGLCRPMALVLVSLDCAALEQALGSIAVPLPEPGTEFLLPAAEVDPDERARFDEYLAGAASAVDRPALH